MPTRHAKYNLGCASRSRFSFCRPCARGPAKALLAAVVSLSVATGGKAINAQVPAGGGSQASRHKICPSRAEIEETLGRASSLMQQGNFPQAASLLAPVAGPLCDPRVSLLLAGAWDESAAPAKAQQTLQTAHTAWPANNSISASLAREYLSTRQEHQAAEALEHFAPTAATPLQEEEVAATAFIATHQLTRAQSIAQAGYKNHPSVQSLLLLANVMQLEGKFKDTVALLGTKRSAYADSAPFLITLAESEYDSILYDAARDDLERAIAVDGSSYQAHFLLGNSLIKLGRLDDGIAEYRTAIVLSPEQPRTFYQLALALQAKQDSAGAKEQLTKALAIDAHYAPALIEMSKILLDQNHASDAVAQLDRAVADNPNSEQAYFLLAKAYAQLGDKEKSRQMAQRMVEVRDANWKGAGKARAQ
jgi:tetratricopeptide (TPR) repeat protein